MAGASLPTPTGNSASSQKRARPWSEAEPRRCRRGANASLHSPRLKVSSRSKAAAKFDNSFDNNHSNTHQNQMDESRAGPPK
jgi:hypothetical protein